MFIFTLQEVLDDNPHVLGAIRWKGDLPFLFKVISISKALSIQAHPDKVCANGNMVPGTWYTHYVFVLPCLLFCSSFSVLVSGCSYVDCSPSIFFSVVYEYVLRVTL